MQHLRGRRVWVTGAGGFVGGHLVPALRAAGAEALPSDTDVDVREPATVAAAVRRLAPHAIVHLAALSSVHASQREARATWEVNYLGTRSVLAAAAAHAPEARVLLVSSGVVYGSAAPDAPPFDEAAPLRPRSPYAWAKACADLLGGAYAGQGLAVLRARPFNHTGAGQGETFVAPAFARQIAEIEAGRREPVLRVGNLESTRDFLDVADVVAAYLRLLDPAVPPGAYNVASGRGLAIGELLERLLARTALRPRIRVEVDPERLRPTDSAVGSARRLADATGWKPSGSLDAALGRLLEGWRETLGGRR